MSTGELLSIEPLELKFPFELRKQISCDLQLSNKTDNHVAFKVKTTNPKKYCVRPNTGVVLPRSTCDVVVTMQAQKEAPPDMQCRDKFLLQSVKASDGATAKDVTAEMFNKEAGHVVEECKLRVVYVSPPQPPSPVREGSEEGSPPRGSDNGHANAAEFAAAARAFSEGLEAQDKSYEAKALISKLTAEKNTAIQQNNKLRQELELLKRASSKSSGGVSFMEDPPESSNYGKDWRYSRFSLRNGVLSSKKIHPPQALNLLSPIDDVGLTAFRRENWFPGYKLCINKYSDTYVLSLSTDRLKKQLIEEGIDDNLVKDCDQIMLSLFSEIRLQVLTILRN
ncbi:hypothetical protein V6N13_021546 [Hibiscus sabdariffa]